MHQAHVLRITELARDYELLLRTLRITRGSVASAVVLPIAILVSWPLAASFQSNDVQSLEGVHPAILLFLLSIVTLMAALMSITYLFVHQKLLAGSIRTASACLTIAYVWAFLAVFQILWLAITALADPSVRIYTTLILSCLLYIGFFVLLIPGLYTLTEWHDNVMFPLLCDAMPSRSILRSVARALGIWMPSGLQGIHVAVAISLAITGFLVEGLAYFAYLQLPNDLVKRVRFVLNKHVTDDILFTPVDAIIGLIVLMALVQGLFIVAGMFRKASRRRITVSADRLMQVDERRPILFLRPFRDDQITLRWARLPAIVRLLNPLAAAGTLDEMVFRHHIAHGPVIAIGSPKDRVPPPWVCPEIRWRWRVERGRHITDGSVRRDCHRALRN